MKIVVAITGATGVVYAVHLLKTLQEHDIETHLVISKWGKKTIEIETEYLLEDIEALAAKVYDEDNMAASVASGSFLHDGMIVVSCSMKTLSGIANGYADGLIQRAADVSVKEKRKLILCVCETPLNPIHLENMLKLAKLDVTIMPPMPAFYNRPQTLDDIICHHTARLMDHLGIPNKLIKRWSSEE